MKFINIFPSNYQGLPEKALAELSTPLYEKVVCNIPFLVMDKSSKLVSKDRLSKLRYINIHVIKELSPVKDTIYLLNILPSFSFLNIQL